MLPMRAMRSVHLRTSSGATSGRMCVSASNAADIASGTVIDDTFSSPGQTTLLLKQFLPTKEAALAAVMGAVRAVKEGQLDRSLMSVDHLRRAALWPAVLLAAGAGIQAPILQEKLSPAARVGSIALVNGFLLNYGVYRAARELMGAEPFAWNPAVVFMSVFSTVLAAARAIVKDLSQQSGMSVEVMDASTAADAGAASSSTDSSESMVRSAVALAYLAAMRLPSMFPGSFSAVPMIGGHLLALTVLIGTSVQLKPDDPSSKIDFNQILWGLLCFEFMLYPFI